MDSPPPPFDQRTLLKPLIPKPHPVVVRARRLNQLKTLRKDRKFSLEELEAISGISAARLSRMERSEEYIKSELLPALARALNCDVRAIRAPPPETCRETVQQIMELLDAEAQNELLQDAIDLAAREGLG